MNREQARRKSGRRIGILGGGQLARMIAEAALRAGAQPVVLAQSETESALIDDVEFVRGSIGDHRALDDLVSRVDVLTVENEFLNINLLKATLGRYPNVQFTPGLRGIAIAQDKLKQKRLFRQLGIPTAEFEVLRLPEIGEQLSRLRSRFPNGYVLKWSRFGYDGRGNLLVRDPGSPPVDRIRRFCSAAEQSGAAIYAEQFIDFVGELAMVSTRARNGDQTFFPLVVSRQDQGVCREVIGPACLSGYDRALEGQSESMMTSIGTNLAMSGAFAMEYFYCRDGTLLANEMAPRVHNTGHYSLFGTEPSQFDLHVRGIMEEQLPRPRIPDAVVMRNLLGPFSLSGEMLCEAPIEDPPEGTFLYWYDKPTVSPGRKMGHLTGRADSMRDAARMLEGMREYERRFWSQQTLERV